MQLSRRAAAALQTAAPASERMLSVHSFGAELVGCDRDFQLLQWVWKQRQAGSIGDTLICRCCCFVLPTNIHLLQSGACRWQ